MMTWLWYSYQIWVSRKTEDQWGKWRVKLIYIETDKLNIYLEVWIGVTILHCNHSVGLYVLACFIISFRKEIMWICKCSCKRFKTKDEAVVRGGLHSLKIFQSLFFFLPKICLGYWSWNLLHTLVSCSCIHVYNWWLSIFRLPGLLSKLTLFNKSISFPPPHSTFVLNIFLAKYRKWSWSKGKQCFLSFVLLVRMVRMKIKAAALPQTRNKG